MTYATRVEVTEAALAKIDAIRNDIIGRQTINWSQHIYPLVAALGEAGFEGEGYEEARGKAVTLIDRIQTTEAERDKLQAQLDRIDPKNGKFIGELIATYAVAADMLSLDPPRYDDIHKGIVAVVERLAKDK